MDISRRGFMELGGTLALLGDSSTLAQVDSPGSPSEDDFEVYGLILDTGRPSRDVLEERWDTYRFLHLNPTTGEKAWITHLQGGWTDIPPMTQDFNDRRPTNSVFGVRASGLREPQAESNFRYNLSPFDFSTTTTNSGNVGVADGVGFAETGTNSGTAEVSDRNRLRYRPGTESGFLTTLAFPERDSSADLSGGVFDDDDGVQVGHDGRYYVAYRRSGTTTKIYRTNWDDPLDGSGPSGVSIELDKLNVYRLSFGYLGSAPIYWEILTGSDDEQWYGFHREEFLNESQTNLQNATFPPRLHATSSGSTNARIESGSWLAYHLNGVNADPQARPFDAKNTRTSLSSSTNEHMLTIRVKSTYQGQTNKIQSRPKRVSGTIDSDERGEIVAVKNATFGTTLSYSDVDTDASVVELAKNATTVSGGRTIATVPISAGGTGRGSGAGSGPTTINAERLGNGDTLTLFVNSPGTINDAQAVLNWVDLF
jgi:hypothetical protein